MNTPHRHTHSPLGRGLILGLLLGLCLDRPMPLHAADAPAPPAAAVEAAVTTPDAQGVTPLHRAVRAREVARVRVLLAQGA